ncbi:MAG: PD-(D/E)XK nuclease family protein [Candidatus Aenigmarchaeota archaeon]|nr:PD-(D/E)XK nuclease family protein [Candidatus Aenigmarchaeota archaeon]
MEHVKVNISDFASAIGYCQFTLVNKYHLGLKPAETMRMVAGRRLHQALEEEDQLVEREEVTAEQLLDPNFDLDLVRESMKVAVVRENGNVFEYVGRTDHVLRRAGRLIIVDDKTVTGNRVPSQLYLDRLVQLAAYCEGFVHTYSAAIAFNAIGFTVVHRSPANEILKQFNGVYDDTLRAFLQQNFQLFEGVYNKAVTPSHHNNPNKCRACRYLPVCSFKAPGT